MGAVFLFVHVWRMFFLNQLGFSLQQNIFIFKANYLKTITWNTSEVKSNVDVEKS